MSKRKAKIEKICCICPNGSPQVKVIQLTSQDENEIDLLTKLSTSVPGIAWDPSFHICLTCTATLNVVYTFIETCIKSDSIRKQQLKKREKKSLTRKKPTKFYKIKQENHEVHKLTFIPKESNYGKENLRNKIKIESKIEKSEVARIKCDNEDEESVEENKFADSLNDDELHENHYDESGTTQEAVAKSVRKYRKRGSYTFKCEKCETTFTSTVTLLVHCKTEHDINPEDVRPYACDRCPRKFGNASNLLQHQKYHDAERCHVCTYCGKGFITKTDLTTHEKHHLNKREYQCAECDKSFNTHKDVRSHKLVVHTDPSLWRHVCEVCDKRFPIKSNYDSHVKRHAGEKNFECNLCHRKFADKCVQQRHMKTHSNIREHKCPMCPKEYKDDRVLRVHMVKIHQAEVGPIKLPSRERKFHCHICPKAYYAKNKLQRHLYAHSGEKPFSCTCCNKRFNDKSYVKQHLKKTHGLTDDDDVALEIGMKRGLEQS